jgi:hypothetical protein
MAAFSARMPFGAQNATVTCALVAREQTYKTHRDSYPTGDAWQSADKYHAEHTSGTHILNCEGSYKLCELSSLAGLWLLQSAKGCCNGCTVLICISAASQAGWGARC